MSRRRGPNVLPEQSSRPDATAVRLRDRFPEAIAVAGDPAWNRIRLAFNLEVDQHPTAIASPRSVAEARAILRAARDSGLRVAPRGSGHNSGPLGALGGAVAVKLDRLRQARVDRAGESAWAEAGARWWDVTPVASRVGLATLSGSSPEVNVAGYSLGGGIGWLARSLGLQSNSLLVAEVLTAEGELVRTAADADPELFWGLRGAAGNFGLVTALGFRLHPVRSLYAGALSFPFERAGDVLHAWREWTRDLPDEVTSIGRTLHLPDIDGLPRAARGRSLARIEAVFLMEPATAAELLAPLRALHPEADTFASVTPAELARLHLDPLVPVAYRATHALLDDLSANTLELLLNVVGPTTAPPHLSLELRHIGGALARSGRDHGALDTVAGRYCLLAIGDVDQPSWRGPVQARLDALHDVLGPSDAGRYPNFTEQRHDPLTMFPPATVARLRALKSARDPDGLFLANHAVQALE